MENLKAYNQVLIAVVGTIFFIVLILGTIRIGALVNSFGGSQQAGSGNEGFFAGEDSLSHAIAMDWAIALGKYQAGPDGMTDFYLIPVISETESTLAEEDAFWAYDEPLEPTFINMVLYSLDNDSSWALFDRPVCISDKVFNMEAEPPMLFFLAAEEDTDGNGGISSEDFTYLYVYNMDTYSLNKISLEGYSLQDFNYLYEYRGLLVKARKDINGDEMYEKGVDPAFLLRYDPDKEALVPLVEGSTVAHLEKLME